MKIRQGFVSNSSSSSFIIDLDNISAKQLRKIQNHMEEAQDMGMDMEWLSDADIWTINVNGDYVEGTTFMDNFDMAEFLEKIGVDSEDINWGD